MKDIVLIPSTTETAVHLACAAHACKVRVIGVKWSTYNPTAFDAYSRSNYATSLPFAASLAEELAEQRDALIWPTSCAVLRHLLERCEVSSRWLAPHREALELCVDKLALHRKFPDVCAPVLWDSDAIGLTPTPWDGFLRPRFGSSGSGAHRVPSLTTEVLDDPVYSGGYLVTEYLPGEEYTVDVRGEFFSIRRRLHVRPDGVCDSCEIAPTDDVYALAKRVLDLLSPYPMPPIWFFQCKRDENGTPYLTEVNGRAAGGLAMTDAAGGGFATSAICGSKPCWPKYGTYAMHMTAVRT